MFLKVIVWTLLAGGLCFGATTDDTELTRRIRQALVADDSLSVNAHNVKIIAEQGKVTLRGPVNSNTERERVASLATKVAGKGAIDNKLEVVQ